MGWVLAARGRSLQRCGRDAAARLVYADLVNMIANPEAHSKHKVRRACARVVARPRMCVSDKP